MSAGRERGWYHSSTARLAGPPSPSMRTSHLRNRQTSNVTAILGGLGAAALWATATLCSSRSSRMLGSRVVLAWVMLVGDRRRHPARGGERAAPGRRPVHVRPAAARRRLLRHRAPVRVLGAAYRQGLDRGADRRDRGRHRGDDRRRPRRAARARGRGHARGHRDGRRARLARALQPEVAAWDFEVTADASTRPPQPRPPMLASP